MNFVQATTSRHTVTCHSPILAYQITAATLEKAEDKASQLTYTLDAMDYTLDDEKIVALGRNAEVPAPEHEAGLGQRPPLAPASPASSMEDGPILPMAPDESTKTSLPDVPSEICAEQLCSLNEIEQLLDDKLLFYDDRAGYGLVVVLEKSCRNMLTMCLRPGAALMLLGLDMARLLPPN